MHSLYSSRYFITVFLVFMALFWCIQDKTPLRYDDFDFLTTYKKDNDGTWKATNNIIQSTDEIIDTCCAHRNIKNGRSADILAILTINGFGKDGFTIFNTLVASLFALLYMRLCRLSYDVFRLVIFLSTALLILPSPFVTIFWRPGACNYLWGAVLFGGFLKIYENQRSFRYSHKKQYLCCILAFLASSHHEALGAPILGMLIVDYVVRKFVFKKSTEGSLSVILSSVLGFIIIISAQPFWYRVGNEIVQPPFNLKTELFALAYHSALPILCLLYLLCRKKIRDMIESPVFVFTILSFILLCIVGNANSRAGFYFSVGVLISILRSLNVVNIKYLYVASICSLVLLFFWGYNFYNQNVLTDNVLSFAKHIAKQKNAKRNQIIVYDAIDKPEALRSRVFFSGIYERGVPEQIDRSFVCWGCEPFQLIVNVLIKDRHIYEIFQNSAYDCPQVAHIDGLCVIRLPLNYVPGSLPKYLQITTDNKKLIAVARTYIGTSGLGLLKYKYLCRVPVLDYSIDYDGKFYYLVLSSQITEKSYVEFPLSEPHGMEQISLSLMPTVR